MTEKSVSDQEDMDDWPSRRRDVPGSLVELRETITKAGSVYRKGTRWRVRFYRPGVLGLSLEEEAWGVPRRSLSGVMPKEVRMIERPLWVTVRCVQCGRITEGSAQQDGCPAYECPVCRHDRIHYPRWEIV